MALTPAEVADRIDKITAGGEDDDPLWVLSLVLRSLDLTEIEGAILRLVTRGGWKP